MINRANTIQKADGNFSIKMKSTPKIISRTPKPKLPVNRIVFLPKSLSDVMAPKVAKN